MAKPKIAPNPPTGDKIPLSRIRLTWTPESAYGTAQGEPITIDGERLAWLLRMRGAQPPASSSSAATELQYLELKLTGLSELLYALSEGVPSGCDEGAIFWFLRESTEAMVRDLQHLDEYRVRPLLAGASVTIAADEPKAAVA